MIQRQLLNRLIIIGFMILGGFCLANAIYSRSITGLLLAVTGLCAGVYFMYLVAKAKQEMEMSREEIE